MEAYVCNRLSNFEALRCFIIDTIRGGLQIPLSNSAALSDDLCQSWGDGSQEGDGKD